MARCSARSKQTEQKRRLGNIKCGIPTNTSWLLTLIGLRVRGETHKHSNVLWQTGNKSPFFGMRDVVALLWKHFSRKGHHVTMKPRLHDSMSDELYWGWRRHRLAGSKSWQWCRDIYAWEGVMWTRLYSTSYTCVCEFKSCVCRFIMLWWQFK